MGDVDRERPGLDAALIDPAGESTLHAPADLDRTIYHGAVTVGAIDGVLRGGLQADRGICMCFRTIAVGSPRSAWVACLGHHYATLACELKGGGGGRGSRCGSRETGRTSNGTSVSD